MFPGSLERIQYKTHLFVTISLFRKREEIHFMLQFSGHIVCLWGVSWFNTQVFQTSASIIIYSVADAGVKLRDRAKATSGLWFKPWDGTDGGVLC